MNENILDQLQKINSDLNWAAMLIIMLVGALVALALISSSQDAKLADAMNDLAKCQESGMSCWVEKVGSDFEVIGVEKGE